MGFASLAAVVVFAAVIVPLGCSSTSSNGGNSSCGSSECAAGQQCVVDGASGEAACRLACTSLGECPFGTYCNDAQPTSWCAPNTALVSSQGSGQWGAACLPTGGEVRNPACDQANGFACYGTSPTDATAFCTLFGCQADSDCAGGWWCATVNETPNVMTAKTSFGKTRSVCLPRAYCAPCKLDHDCPALGGGTPQHCVQDAVPDAVQSADGGAGPAGSGFCAPACGGDGNCPLDSQCKNWQSLCTPARGAACETDDDCPPLGGVLHHCDQARCTPECASNSDCAGESAADAGAGAAPATCQWHRVCTPRAGACVGSGGFCSPCRSDADCTNGFCLSGMPYSTERFCSVKSTTPTCDTAAIAPAGCPAHKAAEPWVANACAATPADQCEGLVVLGTSTGQPGAFPGCWTVNR